MTCTRTFLLALLVTSGCSEVTVVPDPDDPEDPDDGYQVSPCDLALDLGAVTSATLFGDVLHVEGQLDGRASYAVLRLADGVAELDAEREDWKGGASWAAVGGETYARVRGGWVDALSVSALDATSAGLVGSVALGGTIPEGFGRSFGSADGNLFFCLSPDGGAEASALFAVDLTEPWAPGAPVARAAAGCDTVSASRGAAQGSLWVNFGTVDPSWNTDGVALYALSSSGISGVVDHGFAVDGVHHYGYIRDVETDGRVAVATLDNDAYVFLYYRDAAGSSPPGSTVYTSFGGAEKKLLAVVDGVAFVVQHGDEADEIVSYDVHDGPSIPASGQVAATSMNVTLEGATGDLDAYRALARDERRMLVTDAEGTPFLVPLGGTEPVEPMVVVQRDAGPAAGPDCL